ncbi:hypothetical protein P4B35_12000 [Pontiellaceae bacterium B12227]|nr:hypothetical protein [Pontiellaceae bacterium B12227]
MKQKKRFFTKHSKSSAVVVTLALHGIFIVAGLSMVVMSTIIDRDPGFVDRVVNIRDRMPRPRLVPPSNTRNPKPTRPDIARIPVDVKMERSTPDFKLPNMKGLTGEFGSVAGTAGNTLSTIAFAMPELKIFNVKGRGEKIFLILDAGEHMLVDEMGGIPAFTIIKQEMVRIINELPSTAVFNVCVFGSGKTKILFPQLVAANSSNARKAEAWLAPLNGTAESVQTGRYGIQTLGHGGIDQKNDMRVGRFAESGIDGERGYRQERWFAAAMTAMQQQADTVFLLTNTWGHQRRISEKRSRSQKEWLATSAGKRWLEHIEKAREKLAEENAHRKKAGQPPKVISHGRWGLMATYYPDIQRPPSPDFYNFTPREFQEAFELNRGAGGQTQSGLGRKRNDFSFNVVQFVPVNSDGGPDSRFKKLTRLSRGGYQTIAGLEAIRSYLESE